MLIVLIFVLKNHLFSISPIHNIEIKKICRFCFTILICLPTLTKIVNKKYQQPQQISS
jgi:hypothetical protein